LRAILTGRPWLPRKMTSRSDIPSEVFTGDMKPEGFDASIRDAYADGKNPYSTDILDHCPPGGARKDYIVEEVIVGTTVAAETTLTDIEARAGIESLDALQAKRRALIARVAPIRALRDTFDARRRERRGAILALINAERAMEKLAPLAATISETAASGDPRYKEFLDECEAAFATLAVLENDIVSTTERIESRKAELYYIGKEVGLQ
jgi:hypothetical protein